MSKKCKIKPINKTKRLQFAKKYLSKGISFWKKIIFVDESSIVLGQRYIGKCWREKGKLLFDESPKVFSLKYLKVFGLIGYDNIKSLTEIKEGLTSKSYCQIIKSEYVDKGYSTRYKMVQDNDTRHVSGFSRNYFNENRILTISDFPPESPDLNILENIWYYVKKRIYLNPYPRNLHELKDKFFKEFYAISSEVIVNYYNSIKRRLKAVIDSNGGVTKY